jgi:hypothetical protein
METGRKKKKRTRIEGSFEKIRRKKEEEEEEMK